MAEAEKPPIEGSTPWPPEVPPWQPIPDFPWPYPRPPGTPPAEPPHRPSLPEWWEPIGRAADLEAQLLDRRIILLSGDLDRAAATRATAAVMLLDAGSAEPIEIRISCHDGELGAATTLAETIDLARAPVRAVGAGIVGGPAVVAYAAAQRRLAHPHCRFHLSEPRMKVEGRANEIAQQVEQQEQQLAQCVARLAEATGQPADRVASDMRAHRVLTATEARDYGLVHELLTRPADQS